ncbi:MAG: hypothetical protein R6U26_00600 [Candidatus Undinarchaeales archaeon]
MNPEEEAQKKEEEKSEDKPQEENEDKEIEQELEKEDRLPFANARVVSLLKKGLDEDKMVRSRVKKEANEWLGKMAMRVANDMNKSPYTMIEAGDLHRAIKKYEQLERVAEQKERMVLALQRIIEDCKLLISDVERSFDIDDELKRKDKPGKTLSKTAKEEQEAENEESEE